MADPKQKSTLTLSQIDEALKRIQDGSVASVNGINPKLLDNWYFANPVNQRGLTEYPSAGYCLDRWYNRGNCNVALEAAGVRVSSLGKTNQAFNQSIENFAHLLGKTVTLSALVEENTTSVGIMLSAWGSDSVVANSLNLGNKAYSRESGLLSYTFALPDTLAYKNLNVGFFFSGSNAGTDSVLIRAIKLELGSQQTLAHQDGNGNWVLNEIPDYGEQLLKCQRYYQLFSSADARPSDLADYRPNMRANPAIGTIDIGGKTYYFSDANL